MPTPTPEPCTKRRLMYACSDSYQPDVANDDRWPHWIGQPARFGYTPGSINAALVGRADHGIVVVFRGTVPPLVKEDDYGIDIEVRDWLNDFNVPCVAVKDPKTGALVYPGKVHMGFARSVEALWKGVSTAVLQQVAAHPGERLFITGHSKGAALANLFASRIRGSLPASTRMKVVTFAGPRPGDVAFAEAYRAAGIESVRYEAAF
ncbi:MAG: lipase family protein, partial [Sphingomonas sp.]